MYTGILYLIGTPPQYLLLNQSGCILEISWNTSEQVNLYVVRIKSKNTATEVNATSNIVKYPLTADVIHISISAVTQCGHEGPSQTMQWGTPTTLNVAMLTQYLRLVIL